jgi:hypothetical protein
MQANGYFLGIFDAPYTVPCVYTHIYSACVCACVRVLIAVSWNYAWRFYLIVTVLLITRYSVIQLLLIYKVILQTLQLFSLRSKG